MSTLKKNIFKPGTLVTASPVIKNTTFPAGSRAFFSFYNYGHNIQ